MKRTPLFEEHVSLGGRIVPFAGWEMPVQYKGLREEHNTVRTHVGLFDVSHMGEIFVRGSKSLGTLQWLTSNDVSKLQSNEAQYNLLTNEKGGIVDDIIIYCIKPNEDYLVCVNAANIEKDFDWLTAHNKGAELINESERWGQIAIQGPNGVQLTARVLGPQVESIKTFGFELLDYDDASVLVARTGYTGEDGFEVFVPAERAVLLWRDLLDQGQDLGVQPIGLGARDTLRTEMKYSLYGHEITGETDPFSAGLGWVVKLEKGDFIGREVIAQVRANGLKKKLIGLKLTDKGIPREGYGVFSFDSREIGKVTSGTLSPTLNEPIGIAYVEADQSAVGTEIYVDIRGRKAKAIVVKTPFVHAK